ncbi:MAG: phosphoadenosine phosphosulfate reductase family protein [Clostridia bacterium]|nr:phosphoadenosine phosphosulfate reductase family protein [Clostridia bacterium]
MQKTVENAHTKGELRYMQSMSLDSKIQFTNRRLQGWFENWVKYKIYNEKTGKVRFVTWHADELPKLRKNEKLADEDFEAGQVYVSFSGGKDSTVLADITARFCKAHGYTLYLLFVNTGLEYPEIQKFVKYFAQWLRDKYEIDVVLDIVRPEMRFDEVIKTHGYPIISKNVADCVRGAKNGSQSRLNNLNGLDCDGTNRSTKFSKLKWRPLLDVDFDISELCCNINKKILLINIKEKQGASR